MKYFSLGFYLVSLNEYQLLVKQLSLDRSLRGRPRTWVQSVEYIIKKTATDVRGPWFHNV